MVRVSDGKSRPEPARLRLSMETLAVQKEMTVKETRPAMHARVIFLKILYECYSNNLYDFNSCVCTYYIFVKSSEKG